MRNRLKLKLPESLKKKSGTLTNGEVTLQLSIKEILLFIGTVSCDPGMDPEIPVRHSVARVEGAICGDLVPAYQIGSDMRLPNKVA